MILDIVEVAKSHSGVNLTQAFTTILQNFGISDKNRFVDSEGIISSTGSDGELDDLTKDLDLEDSLTREKDPNRDAEMDDNEEELQGNIAPIHLALAKLQKFAFKIIHSTTILLPAWKEILGELKLTVQIMPCDVSTQWNSTFDMLEFALEYRWGIDMITDKWKLGLGVYKLQEHKWTLIKQLRDILKILKDATLYF
ncbi:hypothetical protein PAXINDRAFT_11295 [Paxillus involutus ATCC 200175]|uniref:Uncharacterized protein n=1 Tax=Paxillus involutus ATCC 200175 TaxID=664439 RepID=A0A0C9TJD0_PAXIN|nr:hypothetical protein PAXINDRAFT_11295 [Paxillus involutus ATCC 200175]